jgi:PleD family two-component response regulator
MEDLNCVVGYNTGVPALVPANSTAATILIVDDDEGVTQTFARMLRLEGYRVHTAVSAETGLREAERNRPDAIILDLRMPLMDGLLFLRFKPLWLEDLVGLARNLLKVTH